MTLRKLLKIIVGLLFIFAVVVGLTSINHPIILKWLSASARLIGKPVAATVYANGQVNSDIKIFHVDKYWDGTQADYYLIHFSFADTKDTREIISINKKDKYVGRPSSTNKKEYDKIFGRLFQGEVGGKFTSFTDHMKGYDFDPQLSFTDKTIILKIPSSAKEFKCDSLRIEF
jgi:hypothetical protein